MKLHRGVRLTKNVCHKYKQERQFWLRWFSELLSLFGLLQADLSLRWTHMPFCWFCHEAAQCHIVCSRQAV